MALSITSATRVNGAACDHVDVVVNVEGQAVTKRTSFEEIDALTDDMTDADLGWLLVTLWARYRRRKGRTILNVNFA